MQEPSRGVPAEGGIAPKGMLAVTVTLVLAVICHLCYNGYPMYELQIGRNVMTTNDRLFVNPCGVAAPPRYQLANRATLPPQATLGLLDNGKNNVSLILEQVAEALMPHFGFAQVRHVRKPSIAHACPEDILQALQSGCTVVVNGVGD